MLGANDADTVENKTCRSELKSSGAGATCGFMRRDAGVHGARLMQVVRQSQYPLESITYKSQ